MAAPSETKRRRSEYGKVLLFGAVAQCYHTGDRAAEDLFHVSRIACQSSQVIPGSPAIARLLRGFCQVLSVLGDLTGCKNRNAGQKAPKTGVSSIATGHGQRQKHGAKNKAPSSSRALEG